MQFHHFWPTLKNVFGYPWKNPLLPPPGKNLSDAHAQNMNFDYRILY